MKLSDFNDEESVEVVAKLLRPIFNIASNAKNEKFNGNKLEFVSSILANNAKDVMCIFAILNRVEPSEYHCNAGTVIIDTLNLISDPTLLNLFGLQGQTQTSSVSVSTNGEVKAG